MEDLLNEGLLLLGNTALALLALGLAWLTKWVAARVKNERVAGVVTRLDDTALKVVREVYQAYVEALKVGKTDGKLTEAEKSIAKQKAMDALKSYVGPKGLAELGAVLGIESLDGFLSATIENAVTTSKNLGAAAAANPS